MQTRNPDYIYKNDLDKACSQHDMAYSSYKDSAKRTQSDRILRDKAFKIASNANNGNFKVELDFPSYATKAELSIVTKVDIAKLAAKSDLASLKA